jgi:hypothetical protein
VAFQRPRDAADGVWAPFFWAAVALAVLPGFGLGGALFLFPTSAWWTAAARAHGEAQIFGWAGLMVLGVGFHFLPHLRGRALSHPEQTRSVLGLLVGGLVLRLITEPILNANPQAGAAGLARVRLVLSAVLELAGASVAVALLALTLRGSPPAFASQRSGLLQVLPLLGAAAAAARASGGIGPADRGTSAAPRGAQRRQRAVVGCPAGARPGARAVRDRSACVCDAT